MTKYVKKLTPEVRHERALKKFVDWFNKKAEKHYAKVNKPKRVYKSKTGLSVAEKNRYFGYRKQFIKASKEYLDLMTPNQAEEVRVRKNGEAIRQRKAAAAAAKAASKAKYEADQAYFRENRAAIKRAAMDRHNAARVLQAALAAGFFTVEAYKKHIAERPHPLAKPPEQQAERRRIRDQWRNYRAQVKAGMSANGGRIPRGFLDKQWEMQGGHCLLCDKPLDKDNFEIDHIIPVSRGGANIPLNLQLTHPLCNQRKNDRIFGVDVDHSFFA